jgi:Ca2+-binding RTX toxin-like protein
VDLSVATAQATGYGTDTISGIENLSGGSAADQLLGDLVGNILLGLGGNDRINGREGADMLDGGAGSDTVDGGTGNDLILAGDGDDSVVLDAGDDVVMGGAGVDWLQVSGTTGIRLDLSLTTAQATGFGSDTISGIENVGGSSAADQILGDSVANVLRGHGGNDQLNGRGGTDTLIGGAGADTLAGGADTVRDVFMFTSVKDSSWGGSGRSADIVQQFTSGIDVIDLSGIDANTRVSGDQAFQFSGTSARAYSAWYVADSAGITLRADVSGDNKADLEIRLVDVQALTASDFLL